MGGSITTKVGDKGTTFLFSGEEVSKDCPRTETYGELDELVSVLGIARCHAGQDEVREAILDLQQTLFSAGAELATSIDHVDLLGQRIDEQILRAFDKRREELEVRVRMPDGFIIPGGTGSLVSAHLDHARTVARRLERRAVSLSRAGLVSNPHLLIWLNRVSDYLWLLARFAEGHSLSLKDARRAQGGV